MTTRQFYVAAPGRNVGKSQAYILELQQKIADLQAESATLKGARERYEVAERVAAERQEEIDSLKNTIDRQDKELEEAKAAAARADKAAEKLYQQFYEVAHLADSRLMKIRKLEQQVQTHENTIAWKNDVIARKDRMIDDARARIKQLERLQEGVAVPAVIEAIRALLHDESRVWGWGWDAARFAQELTNRFRGRGK